MTAELKLPPMTVQQMARTLAVSRSRAALAEKVRCRQMIEDFRDRERGAGNEATALVLDQLIEILRAPLVEIVVDASVPPGEIRIENYTEDELPPVHHMDDFAEGRALIQGGMHRRAITGYTGRLGHLRGD